MKSIKTNVTAVAAAMSLMLTAPVAMAGAPYEVWASDQSNSVANASGPGQDGSYIWVWDSEDVEAQLAGGPAAVSMGCDGINTSNPGPCDLHDVFPGNLMEHNGKKKTGNKLKDLPKFGRLHGMLPDPQNRYMNINSFTPGGGYVGIIDGNTKEAVALWRVTQTNGALSGSGRSLHMSFWSSNGDALYLANLHGRILERIDIERNPQGKIKKAVYNRAASMNVGAAISGVADEATAFIGNNAHHNKLVSSVAGDYNAVDLADGTTPSGAARQGAERPTNVIVCPIVSDNDNVYITMGGGGLLVADGKTTPMSIIAEYQKSVVNGAGCGGVQVGNQVFLNAGASAAGGGAKQSVMTIYAIDDAALTAGAPNAPDTPAPTVVYRDTDGLDGNSANTASIGAMGIPEFTDGQLPGVTARRDAHGMALTLDAKYIHQSDRLQNVVEVIDTSSMSRVGTYDLTSADGQGTGPGACAAAAATGVPAAHANDPTPDLMGTTPDGKYLAVATRGPHPVSVGHNAQGACPGVGMIELSATGDSGKLVGVLRTTNTVDNTTAGSTGGYVYTGGEHSDPHGASVRTRVEDM